MASHRGMSALAALVALGAAVVTRGGGAPFLEGSPISSSPSSAAEASSSPANITAAAASGAYGVATERAGATSRVPLKYWIAEDVLTPEEASHIVNASKTWTWTQDPFRSDVEGLLVADVKVASLGLWPSLTARVAKLLNVPEANAPCTLTFLRTKRGTSRPLHHDQVRSEHATVALFFQSLNSGDLFFPLADLSVRPRPGRALVWMDRTPEDELAYNSMHGTAEFTDADEEDRLSMALSVRVDMADPAAKAWLADLKNGPMPSSAEWGRANDNVPPGCLTKPGMTYQQCMMLRMDYLQDKCWFKDVSTTPFGPNPVVWIAPTCPCPRGQKKCTTAARGHGCRIATDCALPCKEACTAQPFCQWQNGICNPKPVVV